MSVKAMCGKTAAISVFLRGASGPQILSEGREKVRGVGKDLEVSDPRASLLMFYIHSESPLGWDHAGLHPPCSEWLTPRLKLTQDNENKLNGVTFK